MNESIINLPFRKNQEEKLEFEIFTLQHLFKSYDSELLSKPQRLFFYMIIYFTRGSANHYIDFKPYSYGAGDIFFISKYQIHYFDIKPDNDGYLILFTEKFIYDRPDDLNCLNTLRIFDHFLNSPKLMIHDKASDALSNLLDTIYSEYRKPSDIAKEPILKNYLEILIWKAEREKRTETHSIEDLKSYKLFHDFKILLEKHFKEHRTVNYYSEMLSRSSKTLNNITKQITNRTAKQFIDQRIILEAKRILSSSDYTTKEITYALGFDEPTNFVKFFKHHTSMTPRQFRDSMK